MPLCFCIPHFSLSFKSSSFQDAFTGLTNGSSDSNKILESKDEKNKVKMPPPKPPLPAALITANISAEAELKKAEEAEKRKPDWLEELSRKQAHRKSGLFSDSKSESSAAPTRYVKKPLKSNDPNTRHKKSDILNGQRHVTLKTSQFRSGIEDED